jgi:hypothetical protein
MSQKLSEAFIYKNAYSKPDSYTMAIKDVITYGEIIKLETILLIQPYNISAKLELERIRKEQGL